MESELTAPMGKHVGAFRHCVAGLPTMWRLAVSVRSPTVLVVCARCLKTPLDEHHAAVELGDVQNSLAGEWLSARRVNKREGVFWALPMVSHETIARPDILHTVHLGVIDHLMKWVADFMRNHKRLDAFNAHWRRMSSYPAFRQFSKEYGAVQQWTSNEMRTIPRILVAILSATLLDSSPHEKPLFDRCIHASRSIIRFVFMLEYDSHDSVTISVIFTSTRTFWCLREYGKRSRSKLSPIVLNYTA
jgi:hypothetical protein